MLSEPDYGQVSVPLVTSCGKESESARWFVGFILGKVLSNLRGWLSEASVLEYTTHLFVTLMRNTSRYIGIHLGYIMFTLLPLSKIHPAPCPLVALAVSEIHGTSY